MLSSKLLLKQKSSSYNLFCYIIKMTVSSEGIFYENQNLTDLLIVVIYFRVSLE